MSRIARVSCLAVLCAGVLAAPGAGAQEASEAPAQPAPAPAPSGSPPSASSGTPGAPQDGARVARKGRRQLFTFTEGEVVRGDVQKPEVSYVIYRQELTDDRMIDLKATFIPQIVGSVDTEPF